MSPEMLFLTSPFNLKYHSACCREHSGIVITVWSSHFSDRFLHGNLVKSALRRWWSRFSVDLPPDWKLNLNSTAGQISNILGIYWRPPDQDGNIDCEMLMNIIHCKNTKPPHVDNVNVTLEGEIQTIFLKPLSTDIWNNHINEKRISNSWFCRDMCRTSP